MTVLLQRGKTSRVSICKLLCNSARALARIDSLIQKSNPGGGTAGAEMIDCLWRWLVGQPAQEGRNFQIFFRLGQVFRLGRSRCPAFGRAGLENR